jgi:hypothetical protein
MTRGLFILAMICTSCTRQIPTEPITEYYVPPPKPVYIQRDYGRERFLHERALIDEARKSIKRAQRRINWINGRDPGT